MKEKKLLFIINEYSSNADQHLFHVTHLIEEIVANGVNVGLIIEKCNGNPPDLGENVKVVAQKQEKGLRRVIELHKIIKNFLLDGYEKIFVRISSKAASNSIITTLLLNKGETYYWISGASLAINRKKPLIQRFKEYFKSGIFFNFTIKHCSYFVTGPESMVDYYHKEARIPLNKIKLLYNDIDINRFHPIDSGEKKLLKRELGLNENTKYVLFVHRFSPIRRSTFYLPYILEGISSSDVTFLFIGGGPEEKDIKEMFENARRKDCVFLGSIPNNILHKYYQISDLFINPSYCEGFPRVVIEAMACGLPVVSTNAGGTADLFGEKQRQFIVDIDDRDRFKDRIREMLFDDAVSQSCIEENLESVKKYSTENVAKMYIRTIFE